MCLVHGCSWFPACAQWHQADKPRQAWEQQAPHRAGQEEWRWIGSAQHGQVTLFVQLYVLGSFCKDWSWASFKLGAWLCMTCSMSGVPTCRFSWDSAEDKRGHNQRGAAIASQQDAAAQVSAEPRVPDEVKLKPDQQPSVSGAQVHCRFITAFHPISDLRGVYMTQSINAWRCLH